MQLQQQTYPSLALSKIVANSLIVDFENRSTSLNKPRNERLLSKLLYNNLQKYLNTKISEKHKRVSLVL